MNEEGRRGNRTRDTPRSKATAGKSDPEPGSSGLYFDEASTTTRASAATPAPEDQNTRSEEQSEIASPADVDVGLEDVDDGSQSSRLKPRLQPRLKRRPELDATTRGRKVFEPQPVTELLRGRYRAVWREMRRTEPEAQNFVYAYVTEPEAQNFVYAYVPDKDYPPEEEPDVDFESLMRDALADFAKNERLKQVDDDSSPT